MQNLILVFATFFFAETPFYSQKPKGGDTGKIGGANAPPTDLTWPQKRGPSRISAAYLYLLGERLLPQSSRDSPPLVLAINTSFSREKCSED